MTNRDDQHWRNHLLLTGKGHPVFCAFNLTSILRHHPYWQGSLWWDSETKLHMCQQSVISDALIVDVAYWFGQEEQMAVTDLELLKQCVLAECTGRRKTRLRP